MLEEGQNILTQNEREVEANPSKYVRLYVGGEVGADKNGGYRGSFGGGGSVIVRPLHCVTVTPVHGFVFCIFII